MILALLKGTLSGQQIWDDWLTSGGTSLCRTLSSSCLESPSLSGSLYPVKRSGFLQGQSAIAAEF